jgi:uncharacterized membrane protein (DUF4010 family)
VTLAGQGHAVTATALGVAVAALLAWKEPLAGFSQALTDAEVRSAILLAILAFVVYPTLPEGTVDPWNLVESRTAWVTVILIAALGFVNYILLELYGARGILLSAFFGGVVNSTVTVAYLGKRVDEGGHGRRRAGVSQGRDRHRGDAAPKRGPARRYLAVVGARGGLAAGPHDGGGARRAAAAPRPRCRR